MTPASAQRYYGGSGTQFNRVVVIYDISGERVTSYRCPDCGHEWEPEYASEI